MFEQSKIISPKPEKALDDQWYARYSKVAAFDSYSYLSGEKEFAIDNTHTPSAGPLEKQKISFIRGEDELPELHYPKLARVPEKQPPLEGVTLPKRYFLDEELIISKLRPPKLKTFDSEKIEAELIALKNDIKQREENPTIQQAYLWKINEKIAETRMLRAAKDGDDERFARYSRFVFGAPNKTVFDYTLFELSKKVERALHADNPLIREIALKLQKELFEGRELQHTEKFSFNGDSRQLDFEPGPGNPIQFPRELVRKSVDTSLEPELSAKEIVAAFDTALREEYQLPDWKVVLSETATAINVSQASKMITVPENRRLKKTALVGLIRHEVGVHATRRNNGERSQFKLLGLGLDRYGDDEGVSTYEEQKVTGADDFAGFNGYLAISLAMGVDGKKRNFREVYALLEDYLIMNGDKPKDAQKTAWGVAFRTFRGTTGKTPGACFTKDLLYRKGNVAVWDIVKNAVGNNKAPLDGKGGEVRALPAIERRFILGKFDPGNPRHIAILDQLRITDEALQKIELPS